MHYNTFILNYILGVIRFWPSIAQESVTIEEAVNLQGQECDSLTSIDTFGCIIATTTCTIALVQPQLISGRHSLFCRTLKVPSGWLGGIGRRVSYIHSYLFGPVASEHSSETVRHTNQRQLFLIKD